MQATAFGAMETAGRRVGRDWFCGEGGGDCGPRWFPACPDPCARGGEERPQVLRLRAARFAQDDNFVGIVRVGWWVEQPQFLRLAALAQDDNFVAGQP